MVRRALAAKTGFTFLLVIAAMLSASGVALAERASCDRGVCKGTRGDDRLLGSNKRDIIYAFKGDDKLYGVLRTTISTVSTVRTCSRGDG